MASIEQGDTIWDYQFQQHETLIVVWGYNSNSKYLSYSIEVSSATAEPKIIKKDIARESYILDIYVLDTKYNGTANLGLIKRTGE
ncbi:hypothetical protein [Mahella australiensis]|uniref:Uncharacterized protein n=1 Tax=Mahella australiensis (strain DSM 15567 / CIP 107919 / 50-1 BON) TaxID=697281 RepID=F4A0L6_MAHA5|nr:hypothetical protein [Mahella australiensis]AEE95895.1 hypothetical protein Mahau_0693 [Mahella australiensis 50-1 BON]